MNDNFYNFKEWTWKWKKKQISGFIWKKKITPRTNWLLENAIITAPLRLCVYLKTMAVWLCFYVIHKQMYHLNILPLIKTHIWKHKMHFLRLYGAVKSRHRCGETSTTPCWHICSCSDRNNTRPSLLHPYLGSHFNAGDNSMRTQIRSLFKHTLSSGFIVMDTVFIDHTPSEKETSCRFLYRCKEYKPKKKRKWHQLNWIKTLFQN